MSKSASVVALSVLSFAFAAPAFALDTVADVTTPFDLTAGHPFMTQSDLGIVREGRSSGRMLFNGSAFEFVRINTPESAYDLRPGQTFRTQGEMLDQR